MEPRAAGGTEDRVRGRGSMRWGESARLLNNMGVCAGSREVRGWERW